jgi:hypothetical protein
MTAIARGEVFRMHFDDSGTLMLSKNGEAVSVSEIPGDTVIDLLNLVKDFEKTFNSLRNTISILDEGKDSSYNGQSFKIVNIPEQPAPTPHSPERAWPIFGPSHPAIAKRFMAKCV